MPENMFFVFECLSLALYRSMHLRPHQHLQQLLKQQL